MAPYLRLIRAGNVGVSFVGTVVGGLAARGLGIDIGSGGALALLLAGASTACVTAGGNILNDLGDRESDRVNHPDRPLVTGAIGVGPARALLVGLGVVSALLILPLALATPLLVAILASAWFVILAYERRLKSIGLPGNAAVAYLTAAVFLYGGSAAGNVVVALPFAAMAFFATLSREVIKDMEDAEGDVDRRTLPRTAGLGPAGWVARGAAGAAIVLSVWPLLTFLPLRSVAGFLYVALVLAADGLFVASVRWLPARLHQEQSTSKLAMTVALLAFVATAFR